MTNITQYLSDDQINILSELKCYKCNQSVLFKSDKIHGCCDCYNMFLYRSQDSSFNLNSFNFQFIYSYGYYKFYCYFDKRTNLKENPVVLIFYNKKRDKINNINYNILFEELLSNNIALLINRIQKIQNIL